MDEGKLEIVLALTTEIAARLLALVNKPAPQVTGDITWEEILAQLTQAGDALELMTGVTLNCV